MIYQTPFQNIYDYEIADLWQLKMRFVTWIFYAINHTSLLFKEKIHYNLECLTLNLVPLFHPSLLQRLTESIFLKNWFCFHLQVLGKLQKNAPFPHLFRFFYISKSNTNILFDFGGRPWNTWILIFPQL